MIINDGSVDEQRQGLHQPQQPRRALPSLLSAVPSGGVTVEWLRDQSRPFTFVVSKSQGSPMKPGSALGELSMGNGMVYGMASGMVHGMV